MASTPRRSVRLWQTELFIIVIVVAILILSVSLSQGLQRTLTQLGERELLSNASALSAQLTREFPQTPSSLATLQTQVQQFREIYGDDVWVYGPDGSIIYTAHDGGPPDATLEAAFTQGLADSPPFSQMTLKPGGYTVAGKAIYDAQHNKVGVAVIAHPVTESLAVLDAVRSRLWITFWVALIAAGLLGFGFSEFIGRRVRQMSVAATAIADGDFDQRLPIGMVPDEIRELAQSYNRMAATLGQMFTALREREQEIAAVVESMGEGVVAFDCDGVVRVANPVALQLLGTPAEDAEVIDRPASYLIGDEAILRIVEEALAGSNVSGTAKLGERTVLLHSTPIDAAEQKGAGAVLLMGDITERTRVEEAQRRFIANASHEMRTPIAALKGMLELLSGGAVDDVRVRDDFLRTMTLEVDRLNRLVTDLLTLAQLEAGSLTLRREPVQVAQLLRDVAAVMQPLAERLRVTIDVRGPAESVVVDCDRDRITQVLVGFVDNALKHSSVDHTVTLAAEPLGDRVRFEVADQGPGIDPELVPRLFDRFFRVDESRAPRGTGLGLSIAKEIVEAHGSAVDVVSALGEGAAFSFELPLATERTSESVA